MGKKNDGGPAYPKSCNGQIIPGMSLRDYFAGQALVGTMSNQKFMQTLDNKFDSFESAAEALARAIYCYSDAMIQERNK